MVPTLRRLLPFVEAWKGLRRRVDFPSGPAFELPPALRSPTNIVRCPRRSVGFRPRRVAHCARLDARRPIDWRMPVARRPHLGGVSYGRSDSRLQSSGASRAATSANRVLPDRRRSSACGKTTSVCRRSALTRRVTGEAELESRSNRSVATATSEGISDFTATS